MSSMMSLGEWHILDIKLYAAPIARWNPVSKLYLYEEPRLDITHYQPTLFGDRLWTALSV